MIFTQKNTKITIEENLRIDNSNIDKVEKTKFLGVIIDQHLTFLNHINYMKGKISRGIGILKKARPYLNESTLKTLYDSFVYPHFTYCIEVWGTTYKTYLDHLVKLQKWAVRTIVGAKRRDSTGPIFDRLNLLRLDEMFVYFVLLFMYKYHNEMLPNVIH